tara:strand:- start:1087 stop:1395 length:309 start_codon:yes stop_codon:yes gene_type:complete
MLGEMQMYVRLTEIVIKPNTFDEMLEYAETKVSPSLAEIPGMLEVKVVQTSENKFTVIGEYENSLSADAAAEQIQTVFGGMTNIFAGPPNVSAGNVIWTFSK